MPLLLACGPAIEGPQLFVGAATSLEPLLAQLDDEFEAKTGVELVFDFSASGMLAQQIREGAPIDVFISADDGFMEDLVSDGFVAPDTLRHFADGVLVMVASVSPSPNVNDLGSSTNVSHVAVANPEIAPYGAAAKRYLEDSGQWTGLEPKIVFGENAVQALQFVRSGNAEVGFVSRSLVSPNPPLGVTSVHQVAKAGRLAQTIGIVAATNRTELAKQLLSFLSSSPLMSEALRRYGFEEPATGDPQ